jgi:hypothetical protein
LDVKLDFLMLGGLKVGHDESTSAETSHKGWQTQIPVGN